MRTAIAAVGIASGAQAQEKLKFAVFTPDAEMTHQIMMKPWAEKVNKESGGTLDIQTFPNGALGRNPGLQTKMLQDGVADIAWVIPSYTPGVYLDDDVFELPNVIQNSTEGSVAAWRLLQKGMLRGYEQYYMIGLFTSSPYTIPHQLPRQKAGRPAGQENPRGRRDLDGIHQGHRRGAGGHAGHAGGRGDVARRDRRHDRATRSRSSISAFRVWRIATSSARSAP